MKNTATPGLKKAFRDIAAAAHRGTVRTGLFLQDAIVNVSPTAHVKTGSMRGSIVVVDKNGIVPASMKGALMSDVPEVRDGQVMVIVTAPYSVYPHEMPPEWLGPVSRQAGDAGPKFVEKKMPLAASEQVPITAESIREFLK